MTNTHELVLVKRPFAASVQALAKEAERNGAERSATGCERCEAAYWNRHDWTDSIEMMAVNEHIEILKPSPQII